MRRKERTMSDIVSHFDRIEQEAVESVAQHFDEVLRLLSEGKAEAEKRWSVVPPEAYSEAEDYAEERMGDALWMVRKAFEELREKWECASETVQISESGEIRSGKYAPKGTPQEEAAEVLGHILSKL